MHPLRVPFSGMLPVTDFNFSNTVSTSITQLYPLDALLGSGGILQAFPQHATPVFMNGVYRLRTRIFLKRIEARFIFVGAVSNAVLAADLYNTVRVALHLSGTDYSSTGADYLTGTTTGTNITDCKRIYFDRTVALPSQAYDTTITTPTPQVVTWEVYFDPNLSIDCFSTNATGAGAAWDTNGLDLDLEFVSDSSISPHPSVLGTMRLIYEYR